MLVLHDSQKTVCIWTYKFGSPWNKFYVKRIYEVLLIICIFKSKSNVASLHMFTRVYICIRICVCIVVNAIFKQEILSQLQEWWLKYFYMLQKPSKICVFISKSRSYRWKTGVLALIMGTSINASVWYSWTKMKVSSH